MYSRYPVFVSLFYRNAINNHYQMIIGKRVAILGITKAGKFHNGVGPKPIQSINFMEKLLNKQIRKSTRLNSSHHAISRMPSSA